MKISELFVTLLLYLDLVQLEVIQVGHEGHDLGLPEEPEEGAQSLSTRLPHTRVRLGQGLQQGRHVPLRYLIQNKY